jgi:hypothetical protein
MDIFLGGMSLQPERGDGVKRRDSAAAERERAGMGPREQ